MVFNTSEMLGIGIQGMFYVLLLAFVIQTVFLSYHWFKYGSSKTISLTALAVYLSGGAILFLTLSLSLNTL